MDVYIGTKIYNCVAYICLFVPRHYQVYIADDPEQLSYDPERPKEKTKIMEINQEELRASELDAKLQLKKWIYFVICNISNLLGIMLTLWGLGATYIFQKYGSNPPLLYCSFIFYIPFVIWLRVMFCPGKEERDRRKYIRDHRLWRKAVNQVRRRKFHGIEDDSDEEEIPATTSTKKGGDSKSMRAGSTRQSTSITLNEQRSSIQLAPSASAKNVSAPAITTETKRSSLRAMDTDVTSKKSKRISFSV